MANDFDAYPSGSKGGKLVVRNAAAKAKTVGDYHKEGVRVMKQMDKADAAFLKHTETCK